MRILIFDPMLVDYDTRSPETKPLGGTQSAILYLARELAGLGNKVTVINGAEPRTTDGVQFINPPLSAEIANGFDVMVVSSTAIGHLIRNLGITIPLILWCHHANDQRAVQALRLKEERAIYAGFAMVSRWQGERYMESFNIPAAKIAVMRNAVSPFFHDIAPGRPWYERGEPPVLAYTSTPFRGLDLLLMGFPLVRARIPGARLKIFSGMSLYGGAGDDKDLHCLYELGRSLPGVEYVGAVPQSRLAAEMQSVDILAYPSTFAETSCIAVLEAMAAGVKVITTPLGALPETTAGFAELVNVRGDLPDGQMPHPAQAATRFAEQTAQIIESVDAARSAAQRIQQIAVIRDHYNWPARARQWHDWLGKVSRGEFG